MVFIFYYTTATVQTDPIRVFLFYRLVNKLYSAIVVRVAVIRRKLLNNSSIKRSHLHKK